MCTRIFSTIAAAGLAVCLCSCEQAQKGGIDRKPVQPVTGKLTLNGEPAPAGMQILAHPKAEIESGRQAYRPINGHVDENGTLSFTTYDKGDGLPTGQYVLTFEWRPMRQTIAMFGAPQFYEDQLQGKFVDPAASEYTIAIAEGENDIGQFDLEAEVIDTTQPKPQE